MARANKNKQKNTNQTNIEDMSKKIDTFQEDAKIEDEELVQMKDTAVPPNLKVKSIESVYQQVVKIQKELETRKIKYSKKLTLVDEKNQKLEEEIEKYNIKNLN